YSGWHPSSYNETKRQLRASIRQVSSFMSKQVKAFVLGLSAAVVLFVVVGGLGVRAASNDGAYKQLGVFSEVLQRVRTEYVEEPNFPAVSTGALHGLVESLDSNSSFLTAAEYKTY